MKNFNLFSKTPWTSKRTVGTMINTLLDSVSIVCRQSDLAKYAAILLCFLTLGVGQMWGAINNTTVTKAGGSQKYIDVGTTAASAGDEVTVSGQYIAYTVAELISNAIKGVWYTQTNSDDGSSNTDAVSITGFRSTCNKRIAFSSSKTYTHYVTNCESFAVLYDPRGGSRYCTITATNVDDGSDVVSVTNSGTVSSGTKYQVTLTGLSASKYYSIVIATNNGSDSRLFQIRLEAPAGGVTKPSFSPATGSSLVKSSGTVTLTSSGNTVYYKWSQTNNQYASGAGSTLAGAADGSGSSPVNATAPSTAGTWYLYAVAYDGDDYSNVVKATYTITNPTHTLTWNLDGGTATGGTAAGAVEEGASLTAPTVTKVGYDFAGWSPNVPSTMPSDDATYTANWTKVYASGTYNFYNNATLGTSPNQKTITTSYADYDAFRIDNIFFSAVNMAYESGSTATGSDYKGWKIKKNNATIKFFVENDSEVTISIGRDNTLNVSYTNTSGASQTPTISSGNSSTYSVKGGTMVTLTMSTSSTITIKQIKIEDMASCSATANAGVDKVTTYNTGVAMAATAASSGYTGAWSIKTGSPSTATSQLSSTSSATATFTPTAVGTYTLIWTVTDNSDGSCYASDEADVVVSKANISPSLSYSSTTLTVGDNSSSPTVSSNPGSGSVSYAVTSASPEGCITVNESTGVVTAVEAGSGTVTATVAATTNYNGNTCTANFTVNAAAGSYDVNIGSMSNGSVTASPISGDENDDITLTVSPSSGYGLVSLTVTGDTSSDEVSTTDNGDGTFTFSMPDEDVTVDATFGYIYSISYKERDRTTTISASPTSYIEGVGVAELPTPTKSGYTFSSWYSEWCVFEEGEEEGCGLPGCGWVEGCKVLSISTTDYGNVTYLAEWKLDAPTISCTNNVITMSAATGATIYYTSTTDGSTPADPTSESTAYNPSSKPEITQDTKFKAIAIESGCINSNITSQSCTYEAATSYTVTYNANGDGAGSATGTTGSVPSDANTYASGADVTVLGKNTLAKTGYGFAGWNTDPDGTGTLYVPAETFAMGESNMVLYADWIEEDEMVGGTLYKAEDMKAKAATATGQYKAGISTNGIFEVLGSGTSDDTGGPMEYASDSRTIDGTSFTKALHFKGTGTGTPSGSTLPTTRAIKFRIGATGKLHLWVRTGSKIALVKDGGSASAVGSSTDRTHEVVEVTAGTWYMYATGTSVSLYGMQFAPCTDPGLVYATGSVDKTYGDASFTNTLTNSHSVTVTYTSSSTSVAEVASNGAITITGVGSTTITASSVAQTVSTVDYCADEASYTLNVAKADLSVSPAAGTASSITHNSATLPFTLSTTTGVASVTLKVYNTSDVLVKTVSNVTANTSGSGNVTGLSASTTYYFTVTPIGDANYNDGAESSKSSTFTTEAAPTLSALVEGTLYKVEDMVPDGTTITGSEQYAEGLSNNTKFFLVGSAASSTTMAVKNDSKEVDGTSFSNSYYFKSAATLSSNTPTDKAIKFIVPTGGGTLKVWVRNAKAIKLAKEGEDGTALHSKDGSDDYHAYTMNVTAGTWYLYATGGSTTLYGVKLLVYHTLTTAVSGGAGGTVSAASSVAEGETTSVTATPATGYWVTGWAASGTGASVDDDGSTHSNTTTLTMGTADATVTVTFGLADYSVTYDGNGGTGTAPTDGNSYNYGEQVTVTSGCGTLTKSGFTFRGWTYGDYFYRAGDKFNMPGEDVTLKAVWENNNGDISCDTYVWYLSVPEGKTNTTRFSFTATPSGSNNSSQTMTIAGTDYTCAKRSSDWNSTFTFSVGSGKTGVMYFRIKGTSTRTITITNTGTSTTTTISDIGTSFATYTSSSLAAGSYSVSVSGNIHVSMIGLYECDVPQHDVTFANRTGFAGTTTLPGNILGVPSGKKLVQPSNPTATGYTFGGWYSDASCETSINWNTMTITADKTIYANWTALPMTYVGGSGSNWSTTANWSPACLPTIEHDVVLNVPVTVDIEHAKAKSVVIYNNGSDKTGKLTIQPNKGLEVTGLVKKTTDGSSYTFTSEADLILESSSAGNASLVFDNSNSNHATVVLYSKASVEGSTWNWQYIGTALSDANALYDYYGSYLYKWSGGWTAVANGANMEAFAGYCIANKTANTTYITEGTLVPTTSHSVDIAAGKDMVLANSWTAPISIASFTNTTFTSTPATVYLFNTGSAVEGSSAGSEAGTYIAVPIASAPYTGNGLIAPQQGFFVTAKGGTAGKITMNYSELVRPAGSHTDIVAGPMKSPVRRDMPLADYDPNVMKIKVSGSVYTDRVIILERADFTEGFDNGWDGERKGMGKVSPSIYVINAEGKKDAVSAIPDFEGTLVGFKAGSGDTEYVMTFNYDGDDILYLNDLKEETSTQISEGNTYTFTTESDDSDARFVISATPFIKTTPTGVDKVQGDKVQSDKVRKVLIDDHLYIIRAGKVFDAVGGLVK